MKSDNPEPRKNRPRHQIQHHCECASGRQRRHHDDCRQRRQSNSGERQDTSDRPPPVAPAARASARLVMAGARFR